jgi:hypothetical protein
MSHLSGTGQGTTSSQEVNRGRNKFCPEWKRMGERGLLLTDNTNIMTKSNQDENNHKLQQIIELLKFALSLDDEEIIKTTVEAVIELLREQLQ